MKKGSFELPSILTIFLSLFGLIAAFLVIVVILSVLKGWSSDGTVMLTPQIEALAGQNDAKLALNTLLRVPVKVNGKTGTVADLIIYSHKTQDFNELEKVVKSLLKDNYYLSINGHVLLEGVKPVYNESVKLFKEEGNEIVITLYYG